MLLIRMFTELIFEEEQVIWRIITHKQNENNDNNKTVELNVGL